jgi:excinuclease ABC subunit A
VPVKYRNRYGRVRSYETTYNGIVEWLERKRNEADGDWSREQAEQYMREVECTRLQGTTTEARSARRARTRLQHRSGELAHY